METENSGNSSETVVEGVNHENDMFSDHMEESKTTVKSVFSVEMSSIPKVAQQEVIISIRRIVHIQKSNNFRILKRLVLRRIKSKSWNKESLNKLTPRLKSSYKETNPN